MRSMSTLNLLNIPDEEHVKAWRIENLPVVVDISVSWMMCLQVVQFERPQAVVPGRSLITRPKFKELVIC